MTEGACLQGCRLAAHIQPQLAPLRQLLPPLGSQLLVPAHSPFVLPPELHPAKIIPGTERQRNMASIAASADAQVEAASPPMVATKAKVSSLCAACYAVSSSRGPLSGGWSVICACMSVVAIPAWSHQPACLADLVLFCALPQQAGCGKET